MNDYLGWGLVALLAAYALHKQGYLANLLPAAGDHRRAADVSRSLGYQLVKAVKSEVDHIHAGELVDGIRGNLLTALRPGGKAESDPEPQEKK